MDAFSHIAFAAKSDVGRKRKNNEDAFGTFPSLGVYCVADGMGGGDDGEIASAAAVGAVEKFVKAHPLPVNAAYPVESVVDGIRSAVNGASKWIFDRAKVRNLKGCGSTFVCLCLDPARPDEAVALHAGDSRLYRIRGRGIQQITKDHSAAELIGARNESELNPMFRGMILRAVGIQPSVEIDATQLSLKEGDSLVICSDGLSRMVPDKKIASIVRDNEAPEAAVEALVAAANEAGGIDNVTVVLVKVGKLPPPLPTVDMPPESDTSDTPTAVGGEASFPSQETETNPSFDIATDESDGDAASFATATRTSATETGATDDQSADSAPRATPTGSGWKAMQEMLADESPKKRLDPRRVAVIAAVVIAAIVAIVFFASSGESDSGKNSVENPHGQRAPSESGEATKEEAESVRIAAERKAAEEARKKAEAEMAAKMADMQRQLKEAQEKAERERAEREAEAKRLEAERKAEEEALRKAEAEAARIAAERKAEEERIRLAEERKAAEDAARKKAEQQAEEERIRLAEERKAAEERAAKEKAEREAEERRREEERQKVLAAQKKAKEEEERIAAERAAKEKAEREAEEKARRHEEEEARRKDEIMKMVLPMLEDARDYYVSDNDTLDYLRCLKRACDEGYELPANEWQAQVKDRFDRRVQFLSFHMRNKKMAEKKNLDQKKLKEEFDEIGELFSGLKYDRSSEIGKGK